MRLYRASLLIIYLAVLLWSIWQPHDYFTWILETFPAILGCAILLLTFRRFQFTNFVYTIVLLHCTILFIGGHYTYSNEPLFNWLKEIFHWQRNNYDKVGHFAQGFVPALIAREVFLRLGIVHSRSWSATFAIMTSLSVSLLYELLEWLVALLSGSGADAFLATQGDIWDTQSDMLFALIGALAAILLFGRLHVRAMARLAGGATSGQVAG